MKPELKDVCFRCLECGEIVKGDHVIGTDQNCPACNGTEFFGFVGYAPSLEEARRLAAELRGAQ
jgi:hypothetical protein